MFCLHILIATSNLPKGRIGYSVREVAVALWVSEISVYKIKQRGKLATVQIEGKKFAPAEVVRVLATIE